MLNIVDSKSGNSMHAGARTCKQIKGEKDGEGQMGRERSIILEEIVLHSFSFLARFVTLLKPCIWLRSLAS